MPVHLPNRTFLINKVKGMTTSLSNYYTVIRNNFWKQMTKLLAYFFKIEMFKATITGVVEKNHYQHNFGL